MRRIVLTFSLLVRRSDQQHGHGGRGPIYCSERVVNLTANGSTTRVLLYVNYATWAPGGVIEVPYPLLFRFGLGEFSWRPVLNHRIKSGGTLDFSVKE